MLTPRYRFLKRSDVYDSDQLPLDTPGPGAPTQKVDPEGYRPPGGFQSKEPPSEMSENPIALERLIEFYPRLKKLLKQLRRP